jgi:hypothetical protein
MCVTGHFVDCNWTLHKRILSFKRIQDHKASSIVQELEDCLLEWHIDRVLTITVDNASSNDATIDQFRRRQLFESIGCSALKIVCGHEYLHCRCCAHVLNLIVSDGLKDVHNSISKVRNMIKYVKSSPQRLETFKKAVAEKNIECGQFLSLDVSTRWNSTYFMLNVAEKYQKAFDQMMILDGHFVLYLQEDGHERQGLGPPTFED